MWGEKEWNTFLWSGWDGCRVNTCYIQLEHPLVSGWIQHHKNIAFQDYSIELEHPLVSGWIQCHKNVNLYEWAIQIEHPKILPETSTEGHLFVTVTEISRVEVVESVHSWNMFEWNTALWSEGLDVNASYGRVRRMSLEAIQEDIVENEQ